MPLARYALYAQNIEIFVNPTWDYGETCQTTLRHIAKEAGCWVIGTATALQGSDIPADFPDRDRLFEPFVSGKSSGMGLGLAVSRAIAEAHARRATQAPPPAVPEPAAPPQDPRHVVLRLTGALGWQPPFKARFEGILGEDIAKLDLLTPAAWAELAAALEAGLAAKKRCHVLYAELSGRVGVDPKDRALRLEISGTLLGREVTSWSALLPADLGHLAAALERRTLEEREAQAGAQAGAAVRDEAGSDPLGDPFEDE